MSPLTPRLSEVARHVVAPKGVISTGWPAIRGKCAEFGISFRWWQHPIGQIILGKRADGKYAATIGGTGLSIPRQVGKTFLVGAIMFALCLLRPNLTVIWTAHRLRTAEETFGKMQKFARRKRIAPFISKVILGSGEEAIEFTNGSRILFGARERGFGRGFDEVDVVVYDEAQILTENALDDMIPAMNQCRQPEGALLLFMGTPPKPTDPGEVFTRMRTEALSGEDDDTAWIEFGSDPGYVPTALPAQLTEKDWKQVARANPSFPEDTPREAILRMRKKLGSDSFLREGLGIWDENVVQSILPNWHALAAEVPTVPPVSLGIAADVDQTWLSLGAALPTECVHLGSVLRVPIAKRAEFVAEVVRISGQYGCPVLVDKTGPASFMIPELQSAMVPIELVGLDRFVQASVDLVTAVENGTVEHGDYTDLNAAVAAAGWRKVGDRRVFARRNGDISALEAVALALHGAETAINYDPLSSVLL